jgi:hypothetical protein
MAADETNDSARRIDVSDTTAEVQPPDPYTEPPNSTVDDWLGQQVNRDAEAVDRALAEAGGDAAKAEKIYDAEHGGTSRSS